MKRGKYLVQLATINDDQATLRPKRVAIQEETQVQNTLKEYNESHTRPSSEKVYQFLKRVPMLTTSMEDKENIEDPYEFDGSFHDSHNDLSKFIRAINDSSNIDQINSQDDLSCKTNLTNLDEPCATITSENQNKENSEDPNKFNDSDGHLSDIIVAMNDSLIIEQNISKGDNNCKNNMLNLDEACDTVIFENQNKENIEDPYEFNDSEFIRIMNHTSIIDQIVSQDDNSCKTNIFNLDEACATITSDNHVSSFESLDDSLNDASYVPDTSLENSGDSDKSEDSYSFPSIPIPVVYKKNEQSRQNKEKLPIYSNSQKPSSCKSENGILGPNKDLCPFCFEAVGHFSRHLFRKHSEEQMVIKIKKMPLKSIDRRDAIISLRKKGNFALNLEKKELKPVRKPSNDILKQIKTDEDQCHYFACTSCLGFYKKNYLWRHKKLCKAKIVDINNKNSSKINHLGHAQTFMATTGLLGNYLNKSRLQKDVFGVMRPDAISFAAKSDALICLFGESYLNKHKRKQMNVVVSTKMRELARLKLALKKSINITDLIDALKPEMYNYILTAAKIISGYDAETQTFKASSLALHLGTSLKFLCDIARKAIVTKDVLFQNIDSEKREKDILSLKDMIKSHWCNDISSLANKVLNESKYDRPQLLPMTEDVQAFNKYVSNLADTAYEKLKMGEDIITNFKLLAECTLSIVLVFNRKRIGEVQFLDVKTYQRQFSIENQKESLSSLTELERNMSAAFKRVVVFGKGSKPVPILFTNRMQKFIDILLKFRRDVVPETNKYIFANPGSVDRWMSGASVLRKFAHKCGAKHPELLTSSRFRKQIATILQLMCFEKDEMEQIARFMGHTEKTHNEFYRLTEDVVQTAKVAKVLLLMNAGKGTEFKGRSLAEIQVDGYVIDYDENENESEEMTTIENESEEMATNEKESEEMMTSESEANDFIRYQHEPVNNSTTENVDDLNRCQIEPVNNNINESVATMKVNLNRRNTKRNAGVVQKSDCAKLKKSNRIRWSPQEKKLVLAYFKKHVKTHTAPRKEECLTLIRQNSNVFKESDWVRIKTLVFNTYSKK